MKSRSVLILSSLVMLSAACSGAEGFDEELDTLEAELSQNEQCQTAAADASFVSDFDPAVSSPTSYGSASCAGGHLVDVTNYNDFSATHMKNRVGIGLATPTSEAECERLRVGTYVWRKNSNGSTTFMGSKWRWAQWVEEPGLCDPNGCATFWVCQMPNIALTSQFGLATGSNYRVASSARRHATPNDSSSSYALRKVHYSNPRIVVPH
jgi:hypothetical protein